MRIYLGFLVALAAVWLAVWQLSPRYAAAADAAAITAAAAICFAAAAIALLPVVLVAPRYPDWLMHAGLAAMLLRLALTLAAGAGYLWIVAPPRAVFMNSAVVFYLVALAAETWIAIDAVRRHWKAPGTRNSTLA